MAPTVGTPGKVPQKTGYSENGFYNRFTSEEPPNSKMLSQAGHRGWGLYNNITPPPRV